jgi:putative PIN family toxin of toxin-antitoxin system
MKTEPAYIVIDTNVLISAGLLPASKTAQVLALAVEHFVIAQNQATWHELETRIARPKFDRYFGDTGRLRHLVKIAQSIQHFEMSATVAVSRDTTDDKFMALAIDSGATILISGDPDLKDVRMYKGIEILSPAQFFERFKSP